MKQNKFLILAIILLFAILPFIQAPSPFISTPTAGCEISPIIRESLKVNQDFDFNFHVFNVSNGVPLSGSTLSCYFHFYNQTGDHVFATRINNDPVSEHLVNNEWAERMKGANISTVGLYAYVVQCNGTQTGCVNKGSFTVTNSGYDATIGRATIDIGLLLVLVIFLIGTIVMFIVFDNIMNRVGMVGAGYLLLIAITFISWQMAGDFLLSAPFLIDMFRILFFVLVIGFFPLVIGGFAWYFIMLFQIKEIQDLMKHGMSEQDAEERVRRNHKR